MAALARQAATAGVSRLGAPVVGWLRIAQASDGAGGGAGASSSPGRILIVEDEYFVALDVEEALLSAGFTVVGVATTAEEAVDLAAAERPDVVLMDIRLAGLRDGIEAAVEIRQRLGIPSLFATAHSDAATRARGNTAASPLGWLAKPYTHDQVAMAMRSAIAKLRGGKAGTT